MIDMRESVFIFALREIKLPNNFPVMIARRPLKLSPTPDFDIVATKKMQGSDKSNLNKYFSLDQGGRLVTSQENGANNILFLLEYRLFTSGLTELGRACVVKPKLLTKLRRVSRICQSGTMTGAPPTRLGKSRIHLAVHVLFSGGGK